MYLKESVASGTNHHPHDPSRKSPPKMLRAPICQSTHRGLAKTWPKSCPRVSGPRRHSRLVSFQTSPKVAEPVDRLVQLIWCHLWGILKGILEDSAKPPIQFVVVLTHKTNKRRTKTHELGIINPNKWGVRIHQQNDLWKHLAFCV